MLFVIGSPIGNLRDITLRALDALRHVNLIAAEDTRRSAILLNHFGLHIPLISFHEHNEAARTSELVEKMATGSRVGLLTDAGMPGVSDPGYRLVRASLNKGIKVEVIPGVSAITTALVGSGLPTDRFYFGGFLPVKSGQRTTELRAALERDFTSVYFESPHRLIRSLEVLKEMDQVRQVCVARELTKHFEEYRCEPVQVLTEHYRSHPPKGEITLVIEGQRRNRRVPEDVSLPGPPYPLRTG